MTTDGPEMFMAITGSLAFSLIGKATVLSAGALVMARLARRRRASIRHVMLATAFIVLLALPVVTVVIPARQVAVPVPEPVQNILEVTSVLASAATMPSFTHTAMPPSGSRPSNVPPLSGLLSIAWAGGAVIVLAHMMTGLMRVRRTRRHGLPWLDVGQLLAIMAPAPLRRHVSILLDDGIDGPMTCGVVRPVIILPSNARQWPMEDLRRAVVHEMEHVRRADWVTLCLARFVCALYWFHPLVWAMWRQMRLEAERACDDAVLRDADPESYADQLVTLAERLVSNRKASSALAMASRDDLSARISALLDRRLPRGRAGSLWIAAVTVTAALVIATIAPLRAVAVTRALPFPGASGASALVAPRTDSPAPDASTSSTPTADVAEKLLPTPPEPLNAEPRPAAPLPMQITTPRTAEAPALPKFEVASVRVNNSGSVLPSLPRLVPGHTTITNIGLRQLINVSHDIQPFQLVGLPGWAETARFDLNATSREDATPAELLLMVRALLIERFQLRVRRESRPADMYTLEQVSPDSSKLRRSQADCGALANVPVAQAIAAAGPDPTGAPGGPGSARCQILPMTGRGRVIATGARISNLTNILMNVVGRQVVDRTNLEGAFDVNLTWTPDPGLQPAPLGLPVPPPVEPDGPSIFTALQEQLGLRLVSGRGPVEMLVIERLEMPTPD